MGESTTMTIRVDRAVKDRLDVAARATNRSRSYLAGQAIEEYLNVQEWQEARIRDALEAADRDEGTDHEKVMSWLHTWDDTGEQSPSKA